MANTSEMTRSRKDDHLRLALDTEVEVGAPVGYAAITLCHEALPEIALVEVDPRVTLLGKELAFPLLVGSMTGGTARAGELNRVLARAAARAGIGMFLGSQRVILERPESVATFDVRSAAPDLPLLIGNVGAVQLNCGVGEEQLRTLVDCVGADALVFHLNPAQEAIQPEGDTDFRGLAAKLNAASHALPFPVGVKEVGSGLSSRTLARLADGKWAFLESAGQGGTSWTLIEGKRRPGEVTEELGELFRGWGHSSVASLLTCVRHGRGAPVIASGGIRSGLDAARAIAAGATAVAMALPLLKAAERGVDATYDAMMRFREALTRAMFLVGARTVDELRRSPIAIDPRALPLDYREGLPPLRAPDAD